MSFTSDLKKKMKGSDANAQILKLLYHKNRIGQRPAGSCLRRVIIPCTEAPLTPQNYVKKIQLLAQKQDPQHTLFTQIHD